MRTVSRLCVALCVTACVGAGYVIAVDAPPGPVGKIAAIQKQVETRPATDQRWTAAQLEQALQGGDHVRTGPLSRAAILYSDQTLQRMGESSELEIGAADASGANILRLLSGRHYFSTRRPRRFNKIETPTVAAAIRGTEFIVEVLTDATTRITMLEGRLEATNQFGTLSAVAGEQIVVEPGRAPVKTIVVRLADSVAWALYYPSVFGGQDAAALAGADRERLRYAADLLAGGRVDEAAPLVRQALAFNASDPFALSLDALLALIARRDGEALTLATRAAAAGPHTAAAALALSFAAQAAFDIPRARREAERAAEIDPTNTIALARASELALSEADLAGARGFAERAVALNPHDARALTVLGFALLTQRETAAAEKRFAAAVDADSGFPLARLGLGLARIRLGDPAAGREELEIASVLDPADAIVRSYLGKAYNEEKHGRDAAKILAQAKLLDPNDPTPLLYDAFVEQNENRPVEALTDIQASLDRNDNRAVYRSRLLLDEDFAVRSADLSRIYADLGFDQLGLIAARRAVDEDPANFSGHLQLAGGYRALPQYAPAYLSELLQARIYQPVSVNAARPDLVNESASFNEYTALVDRPRARGFFDATLGRTRGGYGPPGIRIDDGDITRIGLTGTTNTDKLSAALSYEQSATSGFRVRSDQRDWTWRGFAAWALSHRDTLQVNLLDVDRQAPSQPLPLANDTQWRARSVTGLQQLALGWHREITTGSDLAVAVIASRVTEDRRFGAFAAPERFTTQGPQAEAQWVWRRPGVSWVIGGGHFAGLARAEGDFGRFAVADEFTNAYAYWRLHSSRRWTLTAGGAIERVVAPVGVFRPAAVPGPQSETTATRTELSPKVGFTLFAGPRTTLRFAAFSRTTPGSARVQSLEPTQLAGFSQLQAEPPGARVVAVGASVEQRWARSWFGGFTLVGRRSAIPVATCRAGTQDLYDCFTEPLERVTTRHDSGEGVALYVNGTVGKHLALSFDADLDRRSFGGLVADESQIFPQRRTTAMLRPQLRFFAGDWLGGVTLALYRQRLDDTATSVTERFPILDAGVGYRLPKRWGTVELRGRNLLDREYPLVERAFGDDLQPARSVELSLKLTL